MTKTSKDLTVQQRIAIVERWQSGATHQVLGDDYGCSADVIKRIVKASGLYRDGEGPMSCVTSGKEPSQYSKFVKDVELVLRGMQHDGVGKDSFQRWKDYVAALRKDKFSAQGAAIQASKGFEALRPLFLKYDVAKHDAMPDSHAGVRHKADLMSSRECKVENERLDRSYRDNLRWAVQSAGRYLRTGRDPETTPNDSAWFLYCMAKEEPRDLMAKLASLEGKSADDSSDEAERRAEVKRTNKQILAMIHGLDPDD